MTNRRKVLLAATGGTAALMLAGCRMAQLSRATPVGPPPFTLGVASGYPAPEGVVLWTRLALDPNVDGPGLPEAVSVAWEIATDEGMRGIVAAGTVEAAGASAHSVHVEVAGLAPHRWYWYRFTALGHRSRIGRTRTLPDAGAAVDRLRLCIASCQNYEHGFYAAYRHLMADEPDLVVHVGDYIYEGTWGQNLVRPIRQPEARTLAQYRARHALYKSDPDLQDAHARFPWVMVWDDHEVANDYADARAEWITPPEVFLKRRADAYQAYYEHMPMPRRMAPAGPAMRIHTSFRIGDLASIYLLDDRQYRSPQACPPPGRAGATAVVPAQCEALQDTSRSMLGLRQERWLEAQFRRSGTVWNLLAQQTLMSPLALPGSAGTDSQVRTDGWDGYPVSRQRLLDAISASSLRNPVVVGGDVHAFYAADLHRQPGAASPVLASEFVGTSITSQAAGQAYYDEVKAANRHIRHANGTQRGYLRMTLTNDKMQADMMGLDDVRLADAAVFLQAAFVVEDGRPGTQQA
ncbi:MAG: alkaline phosphatase D family protein [Lautropia sp.]|nr:alkaline phosphatase D family protein [Lautropia sp.]